MPGPPGVEDTDHSDAGRDLECLELLPRSSNTPDTAFRVELTHSLLDGAKRLKYDGWSGTTRKIKIAVGSCVGVLMTALFICILVLALGQKGQSRPGRMQGSDSKQPEQYNQPSLTPQQLDEVSQSIPSGKVIKVPPTTGQPIPTPSQSTTELQSLPFLDPRIDYGALLKPGYHLTPPTGWMNDPNGMFQVPGGPVHVFYQWNPDGPYWNSPWWGHVVSDDLVRWKRLPPALKPDEWYDHDGVFSGSATVLPDGTPLMLYTAVMNYTKYGFFYQQQAAAVPADLSDPYLTTWVKLADNPLNMSVPPGGDHAQFRDPITAWQVDPADVQGLVAGLGAKAKSAITGPGSKPASWQQQTVTGTGQPANTSAAVGQVQMSGMWMTAVGTLDDCVGSASLYLANGSASSWQYVGTLFSQLALNFKEYEACMPARADRDAPADIIPPGSRGYGGKCDQYGPCRMWECPDFVSVTPNIQMFKYSDQARGRVPWAADFYVLGDARLTNYTRALIQDGEDAYSEVLDGRPYNPTRLDYGMVYASKTFRLAEDSSRLLWLGWVYEDSVNCSEVCANGTDFIRVHQKWQGAQTLLREISYAPDTQTLLFNPVAEMQQLRQQPALVDDAYTLSTRSAAQSGSGPATVELLPVREAGEAPENEGDDDSDGVSGSMTRGSHGRQVEVVVTFTLHQHVEARHRHHHHHKDKQEESLDSPLLLGLRINTGNSTHTDVLLYGRVSSVPVTTESEEPVIPTLTSLHLEVDRRWSGGLTPANTLGGRVPLPEGGRPAQDLQLSVFVDRSIVEVYALSGAAVMTSRIYSTPTLFDQPELQLDGDEGLLGCWGYEVLGSWAEGDVRASVQMFGLDSCWEDA